MNTENTTLVMQTADFLKGCEHGTVTELNDSDFKVGQTLPSDAVFAGTVKSERMSFDLAACTQALVNACHGASLDSGWWHDAKTGTPIIENPMCFSNKLMLTVSELAEAMEADRKNLRDDKLPHRDGREVELADAVIRIFDLAGAYHMDLGGAIVEKMAFNKVRPDHQLANRKAAGGKAY